jgi:hypothetical protein
MKSLYFTWHGHLNIRFPLLRKHHVSITGNILRVITDLSTAAVKGFPGRSRPCTCTAAVFLVSRTRNTLYYKIGPPSSDAAVDAHSFLLEGRRRACT